MRGKVLIRVGITPVQGDTARHLGVKDFFGDVSAALTVLRTDGKTVLCEKGVFGQVSAPSAWVEKSQRPPNVVIQRSSARYGFIGMEGLIRLISKRLGRITDHKRTELGSVGEGDGMGVCGKVEGEANGVVRGGWGESRLIRKPVHKGHPGRETNMAWLGCVRRGHEEEREGFGVGTHRERPILGREIHFGEGGGESAPVMAVRANDGQVGCGLYLLTRTRIE
jgi:hypothetical protein